MKKLFIITLLFLPVWAISQTVKLSVVPIKPKLKKSYLDSIPPSIKVPLSTLTQAQILKYQQLRPLLQGTKGKIGQHQIDGMPVVVPDVSLNAKMPVGSAMYFLQPLDAIPNGDPSIIPKIKK